MKKNIFVKATLAMTMLMVGLVAEAQVINRTFTSNTLVNTSPDRLRVMGGLIAHDGAPVNTTTGAGSLVGTFAATAKWIGLGAPVTPGNLLYGERTQWDGQAFVKGLRQRSTTDVTKDAILEWGGGNANQNSSEMQFRFITNPTSPTGFTRILTMNTSGNSYFGATAAIGTPKMGVTGNSNQYGFSSSTQNSIAGYFQSVGTQNNSFNYGVYGRAIGINSTTASFSIGVIGVATGNNTRPNYGIYGFAPVSPTSAFGNTSTSYAGFYQGDVYVTNLLIGSDKKYKANVKTEVDALSKIMAVRPVTYDFDTVAYKGYNFSTRAQHGFIAQELQEVFPEAVQNATLNLFAEDGKVTGTDVGLSVNYVNLISILYKGVQEQQEQINQLRELLAARNVTTSNTNEPGNEARNNNAATAKSSVIKTNVGEFKADDFEMGQNVPNPFSASAIIRYTLPSKVTNAFIGVYSLQGTQVMRFDRLNASNQVTINSNRLAPGMYIYSLVVEGQEVMSKKMVIVK